MVDVDPSIVDGRTPNRNLERNREHEPGTRNPEPGTARMYSNSL